MRSENPCSIIVTSQNQAKVDAAAEVARQFFPNLTKVEGIRSNSSVSETPVGDNEALEGCINRIAHLRADGLEADLFVSIEGCIEETPYGTFVYSWAVVEQKALARRAFGCSAKVRLPDGLAEAATAGASLAKLTQGKYGIDADVRILGTNGVVTNGAFTRTDEFTTALRAAFGYLANNENFSDQPK